MYVDPSGHSALLVLGIIAASLVVGGAIYGGVSAGMADGDFGDVMAGIGKGALTGGILGAGVLLTGGGIIYGAGTVLGSIMVTYGASITANILEVAVTQGKKSYYDGDSFWSGVNDITNAMFANSGRILAGNLALDGLSIMGTRMFSRAWTLVDFFGQVNATAQYWKYSKAMSIVSSTFWKSKANPLALIVGYGLTGYQLFNLGRAIFTTPDFENSPWILY